ncbi:taurine catabolism dioxygenase TauD [Chitinophaga nivalis]|uniref:Taurine catabolism dioxygenase TauD n=1 Tax=Chitinophaga nivalis TaxID=2991709 RepID=A0ABT3IQ79_9BACT|nr:taurine catabolism dioxygenase TauD [Chitinophaga nivalis]MCW3464207.1 taurine catabolism dioxygenase TauD [Chitinophaga nivalis]MCW3486103.1 taurine catabolism dioxygenase TauD [Chitinophaga nivalis]
MKNQTATLPHPDTPSGLSVPEDQPPLAPLIVDVTARESAAIQHMSERLLKEFSSYEHPDFIAELHLYASQLLPERIARILSHFGTDFSASQYGAIVFRGLISVDQDALGPTPPSWKEMDYSKVNLYGFICSLLHGAVPSKPVQYYAQRKGGGLLHAVIPDEQMSYSQTGSGSRSDLFVHTEDAFLFNQADFLSFLYLRNEERVASTLYSIRSHGTTNDIMQPLFRPLYKCPKDANYDTTAAQGEEIATAILYGNEQLPFIRFDAAEQLYNEDAHQSPEAMEYLRQFWQSARELIYNDYIPSSGDLVFVNNHLCAHGRNAFLAGMREENGQLVACPRRMMLRMMSKTSLIQIRAVTHPDDPYLVMEEHYGSLFKEK